VANGAAAQCAAEQRRCAVKGVRARCGAGAREKMCASGEVAESDRVKARNIRGTLARAPRGNALPDLPTFRLPPVMSLRSNALAFEAHDIQVV